MNGASSQGLVLNEDWTPQQVLDWMDSFRALILETQAAADCYERVRQNDPLRRPAERFGPP